MKHKAVLFFVLVVTLLVIGTNQTLSQEPQVCSAESDEVNRLAIVYGWAAFNQEVISAFVANELTYQQLLDISIEGGEAALAIEQAADAVWEEFKSDITDLNDGVQLIGSAVACLEVGPVTLVGCATFYAIDAICGANDLVAPSDCIQENLNNTVSNFAQGVAANIILDQLSPDERATEADLQQARRETENAYAQYTDAISLLDACLSGDQTRDYDFYSSGNDYPPGGIVGVGFEWEPDAIVMTIELDFAGNPGGLWHLQGQFRRFEDSSSNSSEIAIWLYPGYPATIRMVYDPYGQNGAPRTEENTDITLVIEEDKYVVVRIPYTTFERTSGETFWFYLFAGTGGYPYEETDFLPENPEEQLLEVSPG